MEFYEVYHILSDILSVALARILLDGITINFLRCDSFIRVSKKRLRQNTATSWEYLGIPLYENTTLPETNIAPDNQWLED